MAQRRRSLDNVAAVRLERIRRRLRFDPDATVIAELSPSGVPLGVGGDGTRVLGTRVLTGARPRFVALCTWLVVAVMTVYGARDVQAFVLHDEVLARSELLVGLVNGLTSVSRFLGPARVREAIDVALSPIKTRTDSQWAGAPTEAGAPDASVEGPSATGEKQTRVLLVGASSMEFYLGAELERRLESYQGVKVHRFGKLGTGLARPDDFDWPKQLRLLVAGFRPDVVIGQFGGNDGQPLEAGGKTLLFGTPEWDEEYTRRVRGVVDLVHEAGARVVMLGMPITRHKKHSDKLKHVNDVTRSATEAAGGAYVATWDLAMTEAGEARATIDYKSQRAPMYLADGVHYARLGAAYVAEKLCWRLEREFPLVPGEPTRAAVLRLDLPSRARNQVVTHFAFVPQPALRGEEKLPVLYLLHGAGESAASFADKGQEPLQLLAATHRVVIVLPDGTPDGWYVDSPLLESSRLETFLLKELLPEVEKRLPVDGRSSIGGISMGGNGALALGLRNAGTFAAASSMSGAVDLAEAASRPALVERLGPYEENKARWEAYSALHLVRERPEVAKRLPMLLTVGSQDRWAEPNRRLHAALTELGAEHSFREQAGEHAWAHWLAVLPEHVAWHAERLHQTRHSERATVPKPAGP